MQISTIYKIRWKKWKSVKYFRYETIENRLIEMVICLNTVLKLPDKSQNSENIFDSHCERERKYMCVCVWLSEMN